MSKRMPSQWYWPKVDTSAGPDLCWPWTGNRDRAGYGRFDAHAGIRSAHRFAYLLAFGEIPDGMCVLHRCDNPPCQNPGHLFLGTQADNMADMASKGRGVSGTTLHPELVRRGQEHWSYLNPDRIPRGVRTPAAKLNDAAVRDIRKRVAEGVQQKDLAAQFGVSTSAISQIVARKTWGHVV
jgi:hypothetical protein